MRDDRFVKQSWWVERSNSGNPRHKDYAPVNIDEVVESNDNSINKDNDGGFWGHVYSVAGNIYAGTPTPVKAGVTGLFALWIAACGGETVRPVVAPTNPAPTATARPADAPLFSHSNLTSLRQHTFPLFKLFIFLPPLSVHSVSVASHPPLGGSQFSFGTAK